MTTTIQIRKPKREHDRVDPVVAKLGGDHDHEVQWHNSDEDNPATVSIDESVWTTIFNEPYASPITVGAGGHDAPVSPLTLKGHADRQKGKFSYSVSVENEDDFTAYLDIQS